MVNAHAGWTGTYAYARGDWAARLHPTRPAICWRPEWHAREPVYSRLVMRRGRVHVEPGPAWLDFFDCLYVGCFEDDQT